MSQNAVVLIGDQNYIIPSTATALSARKHTSRDDVEIIAYFVAENTNDLIDAVAERLAVERIQLKTVAIGELLEFARHHHDKAVPVSTLSRFWLHRFLPPEVEKFLYLDGDILVGASLDPLFDMELPSGGFLAADDCLCLYEKELRQPHRYWKPYLESIGVEWQDYFNTGVILADRAGWERLAAEALDFLMNNRELCRSSDQTALNVVAGRRRGRLPLRWNYQTEHMMVLDPRTVGEQPAVWHFAAGPKPWELTEWPWDDSFNWAYREAQKILSGLDVPLPPVNQVMFEEGCRHRRRQRNLQRWRFLYRRYSRARTIKAALR